MIKIKASKSKNKIKAYFLYIFILIFLLILLSIYNSCGDSQFSSFSSKTDANNNLINTVSKTETHIVHNSNTPDSKKEIDFHFVVDPSLATAKTYYAEKLNKFLEFITDGVHLNSRVSISRMGPLKDGYYLASEAQSQYILHPFTIRNPHYTTYVESIGNLPEEGRPPLALGPDPLKRAFSLLSNIDFAIYVDQVIPSVPRFQLKNILTSTDGVLGIIRRKNIPLKIIVISAISIGRLNSDASVISRHIITNMSNSVTNFKMSAITTTGTHCIDDNINIASDQNGSSSQLLQEVAQQVSRNENPVIIDICSDQSNYDRQLGAILRPHGITYPNVRKTSFKLHHTPAQEFPITIKKRSGDIWTELSDLDINYSIEFTDGNTLFVLRQPQQNLLPPGEYQIHYYTTE